MYAIVLLLFFGIPVVAGWLYVRRRPHLTGDQKFPVLMVSLVIGATVGGFTFIVLALIVWFASSFQHVDATTIAFVAVPTAIVMSLTFVAVERIADAREAREQAALQEQSADRTAEPKPDMAQAVGRSSTLDIRKPTLVGVPALGCVDISP